MADQTAKVRKLLADGKAQEASDIVKSLSQGPLKTLLMGEVALAKEDHNEAIKIFKEAWAECKQGTDKQLQAGVLTGMVRGLYMKGMKRESLVFWKEALKAASGSLALVKEAGDKGIEAEMLHTMAMVQVKIEECGETAGLSGALNAEAKAIEYFKVAGNETGQAEALTNMAKVEQLMGRFGEAIASSTKAAAMWKSAGVAKGMIEALSILAKAQVASGTSKTGVETIKTELAAFRAAGADDKNTAMMYEFAIQAAVDADQKVLALGFMEEYVEFTDKKGLKSDKAKTLLQSARASCEVGALTDGARQAYEASVIFKELGDGKSEGEASALHDAIQKAVAGKPGTPLVVDRADAKHALKEFIHAAEGRDQEGVKKYEEELNKYSAGLNDQDMRNALELLFLKDPSAMAFLEDLGWDLTSYKTPSKGYQWDIRKQYFFSHHSGVIFGPHFRGTHPYRKGKFSEDSSECWPMAVIHLPAGEAWYNNCNIKHQVMDNGLQSSNNMIFNPQ